MNNGRPPQLNRICWLALVIYCLLGGTSFAQLVRWGPFRLNVGASAGVEYSDNINNSSTKPESDIRLNLGPTVNGTINTGLQLPGGEPPTISLSGGYSAYYSLKTGEITGQAPDNTSASVPIEFVLANCDIRVLDTVSYSSSALDATFSSNKQQVNQVQNTASVSATRQFGKPSLTVSALRTDYFTASSENLNYAQYNFSITPAYALNQYVTVFMQNSYYITDYTSNSEQDSFGFSSAVGVSGQITANISGSISLGWSHTEIEAGPTVLTGGIFDGIYDKNTNTTSSVDGIQATINLNYTHPLRPGTVHSITVSQSQNQAGALQNSSITQVTAVNYIISHQLNRKLTLSPSVGYIHLNSLSGSKEVTDIFSVHFGITRTFTQKFNATLIYLYQSRNSNLADGSYDVNQVNLNLNYTF